MSIIVIDPPEDLVVSLEEAKVHLRVDHDDDDDYIEALIAAATATIDGPDGWLGRALVEQTLEWQGNQFCGDVTLGYPPLINIVSVKYIDTDGVEQIVPSDQYRLVGSTSRPRLALAYVLHGQLCGPKMKRSRCAIPPAGRSKRRARAMTPSLRGRVRRPFDTPF